MTTGRPDDPAGTVSRGRRPATVLLVEDSAADAELARLALAGVPALGSLQLARTGEEALRFLRRVGEHRDAPRPDLVLLDLNLPGVDGREVLVAIRADPALRALPVVVLTSSADPADVEAGYRAGANSYVTKPFGLDEYLSTLHALAQYWLTIATLPVEPAALSSGR